MNIYIMRHGETLWNQAGKIQGHADICLSDVGREQAREKAALYADVPFDKVYSSPLARAQETARIMIGERPLIPEVDGRLIEIDFGEYEGDDISVIKADESHPIHNFIRHPADYNPPEGVENLDMLYKRAAEFIQEKLLPLEGSCEHVLVVAHGALDRALIMPYLQKERKDYWKVFLPNCAVVELSLSGGEISIRNAKDLIVP